VHLLLVTNGDGGGGLPADTSAKRKDEMSAAARTLGIANPVMHLDEPDGKFADSPAYRSALSAIVERVAPNWVFLPWLNDTHPDHARISRASSEVLRRSSVESLLYYETWTPVPATHVVDITETLEIKKAALQCHATALQYGNYMDAMLGLNAYRALYLPPGVRRWAEAFAVTGAKRNDLL
jgi:LmbE family N-acetylglucosaminyl deacetylase